MTTITLLSLILTVIVLPVTLSQEAEASHPRNLRATPQDESVDLTWSASTSSSVVGYEISYKLHDDSTWSVFNDDIITGTSITVTGLENGESYDFKVTGKTASNVLKKSSNTATATPTGSSTPPVITPPTPTITVNPPTNLVLIPQHKSMILEWDKPRSGTTPTDYLIQYKYNFRTTWSNFTDGVSTNTTATVTSLTNEREYDFKVASKVGDTTSIFSSVQRDEPTDKCSQIGADDNAYRCYATQVLDIKKGYHDDIRGFKGTINAEDVNVLSGFNNAAYWLTFIQDRDEVDNPIKSILEVGIMDYSGSRSHLKTQCAEDGIKQRVSWSLNANRDYTFEIIRKSTSTTGDTWGLTVNGHDCRDIIVPPGSLPDKLKRGTETSYNSSPDFTQEFDSMKFKWWNGEWYTLRSFFGPDYRDGLEQGYFIDQCGSTSEGFYHIETGKGTERNCQ